MQESQCRICLNEKNCGTLYAMVLEQYYLPTVIEYVCGVQISTLDEPNAHSCIECALALVQAELIIRKFRASQELLQQQQTQVLLLIEDEQVELDKEPELELGRSNIANQDWKQENQKSDNDDKDSDKEHLKEETKVKSLEADVKLKEKALQAENGHHTVAQEEDTDYVSEWEDGIESTCDDDDDDEDDGFKAERPREKRKRRCGTRMNLKVNRQREFHFRCDLCEFETKFAKYFRDHLKETHQQEKPRIFKCVHCSEAYMEHRTLREHVARVHEGQPRRQRFLCSDCGKGFGKHSHLVRHSFVHRPEERPFQCEFCPMMFVNLSSLKRHMVTSHAEGKPFVCDHCDKTFGCVYNLRAHKKRLHSSIKQYECSLCKAKFRLLKSLNSHQQHGCRK